MVTPKNKKAEGRVPKKEISDLPSCGSSEAERVVRMLSRLLAVFTRIGVIFAVSNGKCLFPRSVTFIESSVTKRLILSSVNSSVISYNSLINCFEGSIITANNSVRNKVVTTTDEKVLPNRYFLHRYNIGCRSIAEMKKPITNGSRHFSANLKKRYKHSAAKKIYSAMTEFLL